MEARYFISNWKIIRVNSIAGKNLSQHSRAIPPLYLLCDEVVCSWNEKGKVMRKLLADIEREGRSIFEGVQFKYTEKVVLYRF